jgi:hypothetical protein
MNCPQGVIKAGICVVLQPAGKVQRLVGLYNHAEQSTEQTIDALLTIAASFIVVFSAHSDTFVRRAFLAVVYSNLSGKISISVNSTSPIYCRCLWQSFGSCSIRSRHTCPCLDHYYTRLDHGKLMPFSVLPNTHKLHSFSKKTVYCLASVSSFHTV